tara:strand:- start:134823 stop:134984 length:162 start_codon:yes stop_codon:yes gene_type:complete
MFCNLTGRRTNNGMLSPVADEAKELKRNNAGGWEISERPPKFELWRSLHLIVC